jgi:hypothetical protein
MDVNVSKHCELTELADEAFSPAEVDLSHEAQNTMTS